MTPWLHPTKESVKRELNDDGFYTSGAWAKSQLKMSSKEAAFAISKRSRLQTQEDAIALEINMSSRSWKKLKVV
jgi:hypothetical protein